MSREGVDREIYTCGVDGPCPGITVVVLCSGPETCLLQCCERGVAMESCLCLPESPTGLSGAGCQDPGDELRL